MADAPEPIAIVGMACRLPGEVNSPSSFWQMLLSQRSGYSARVPSSRFSIDSYLHSDLSRPGSFTSEGGYFLSGDLADFDPSAFGISPIEAKWLDPQQRKLLEVVWECFENSGTPLSKVFGTDTGVFVGSFTNDWQSATFGEHDFRHAYAATGVDPGLLSTRINHVFNLRGPSCMINTACASSVTALHQACNSLLVGDCSGAIVAGSNLIMLVDQHMNTAKLGVLSPTSECHTFDAKADGYGRAEGVGALYVKKLSTAVRDGDNIRAVIRATAINTNGKVDGVGITYPGLDGQEQVIRKAYERAQIDPLETGFFECHGTGTPTGDPLEVLALSRAMNQKRGIDDEPLLIGAVKPSIGHSEAASGIAAVMKAALAVETGVIPPVYGFKVPNPQIDFDGCKVKVVEQTTPWPEKLAKCRRASVNSFGYGGSNGHVIVESVESILKELHRWSPRAIEPSLPKQNVLETSSKEISAHNGPKKTEQIKYLLVFSAHDKKSLWQRILQYQGIKSTNYKDLAYTLAERRSHLPFRAFSVIDFDEKLKIQLKDANVISGDPVVTGPPKGIAFIFTGQGAQWKMMGGKLIETFSVFRQTISRLDNILEIIEPNRDWTIEGMMTAQNQAERISEARYAQPMTTGLQIALVDLLADWGISASITVGHSSGEIAAAYAAGLISAAEAITVAYCRGKAVTPELTAVRGAMIAVGLGPDEAQALIRSLNYDGRVEVACRNSPNSTTLSGNFEDIDEFKTIVEARQIFSRQLDTGGNAYHSRHMKQYVPRYKALMVEALKKLDSEDKKIRIPKIKMQSSVTLGKLQDCSDVSSDYWCQNLVQPVLFDQALGNLIASKKSEDDFQLIEIGPHPALSAPVRQILKTHNARNFSYAPTLKRARAPDSIKDLLTLAGSLYIKGISIDLKHVNRHLTGAKFLNELPPYPWQYKDNLWAEPRLSRERRGSKYPRHDILGRTVPGGTKDQLLWRNVLRQKDLPWLAHHTLGGDRIFPAAGYWCMAIEAIRQVRETRLNPISIESVSIQNVLISTALNVPDDEEGVEVLLSLSGDTEDPKALLEFQVSSCMREVWTTHCKGRVGSNLKEKVKPRTIENLPAASPGWRWYNQAFHNVGFEYGPSFNALKKINSNPARYEVSAEATLRANSGLMKSESRYLLHPGTIDASLQLILIAIYAGKAREMSCGFIPVKADDVTVWTPNVTQGLADGQAIAGRATSWAVKRGHSSVLMGAQMSTDDRDLLVDVTNLRAVAYEAALPPQIRDRGSQKNFPNEYFTKIEWKPDIDQLFPSVKNVLEPTKLAELAVHKNPNMRILTIGSEVFCIGVWGSVIGKNKEFFAASEETFFTEEDFVVVHIDPKTGLHQNQFHGKGFDLVFVSPSLDVNYLGDVKALLNPSGEIYGLSHRNYSIGHTNGVNGSLNGVRKVEKRLTIVCPPPSHSGSPLLNPIKARAIEDGWSVSISELGQSEISPESDVVMLVESEKPMLVDPSDHTFRAIQHVLVTAASVVWITNGALLSSQKDVLRPEFSLINGLMRSASHDCPSLRMATLDVDADIENHEIIADVAIKITSKNVYKDFRETEMILKDGVVHISRLVRHRALNDDFPDINGNSSTIAVDFAETSQLSGSIVPEKPFALVSFSEQQMLPPTTNTDDGVLIRVCEAGLNQEVVDVLTSRQDDIGLSYEIGGIVCAVGKYVEQLVPGDRVVGFVTNGNYSTHVEIAQKLCVKLEESEAFQPVIANLLTNIISTHTVDNLAHISSGEKILITDGIGIYGLPIAYYAQSRGAIVYLSLESQADTMFIRGALRLPANRVITIVPGTKLYHKVSEITNGAGFDIVVTSGMSSDKDEAWKSVGVYGRLIQLGKTTASALPQKIAAEVFDRGASFHSFDWREALQTKPALVAGLLQGAIKYSRDNTLSVHQNNLVQTITLGEINQAVKAFSNSIDSEKVIVSYTSTIGKPVTALPLKPHAVFDSKASYILVGALGGLGRTLAKYMVKNGARNLVFLGRSGASNKAAKQLIQDLQLEGVNTIVVKGDVGIYQDVFKCFETAAISGPVKGVVHAPMVLHDTSFERMTPQQFRNCIKSKVQGAINLHQASSSRKDFLDFFIMTSSVSGILGTPGQANYAAGNAFLDSFAAYRKNLGLPTTSIALPMLLEVGWVVENDAEGILENFGIYGIDEAELINALDIAIMTSSSNRHEYSDGNFAVGLEPKLLAETLKRANLSEGFYTREPRFAYIQRAILAYTDENPSSQDSVNNLMGVQKRMKAAGSTEEAVELATDHILTQLSKMILIPRNECVPKKPLSSYGLDSMLGTELRRWLFNEFGVDISYQQLVGADMDGSKLAQRMCADRLGRV